MPRVGLQRVEELLKRLAVALHITRPHRHQSPIAGFDIDQAPNRPRYAGSASLGVEDVNQIDFELLMAEAIQRPLESSRIEEIADQYGQSPGAIALRQIGGGGVQAGLMAGTGQSFQKPQADAGFGACRA